MRGAGVPFFLRLFFAVFRGFLPFFRCFLFAVFVALFALFCCFFGGLFAVVLGFVLGGVAASQMPLKNRKIKEFLGEGKKGEKEGVKN